MKNLFTYLLLLPAILLASCTKLSTAHSERHYMYDGQISLGQPVDSFFNAYASLVIETYGEYLPWHVEKYGDKAYFQWEDDPTVYMADLYNDTIYCIYLSHDWPYPDSLVAEDRRYCDTILWEDQGSCAIRYYKLGGYEDYIYEPDGWNIAFVDSLGLARHHELHKQ